VICRKMKLALATSALAAAMVPESVEAAGVPFRNAVADSSTQPQYMNVVATRHYQHRYVVKRRSKAKSLAIVGGSAAGGAAIGALAGGGKGAGIGALAGGAAGFIYDRKTHKKVVRQ
jgi:outer membrane lipoprotein SlyB